MSNISNEAICEIRDLQKQASRLAHGTASDRKQADVILSKISHIEKIGLSTDEVNIAHQSEMWGAAKRARLEKQYERAFKKYIADPTNVNGSEAEIRAVGNELWGRVSGQTYAGGDEVNNGTYNSGKAGGYTVPTSMFKFVLDAMAQYTPLTDPNIANVIVEDSYAMRGKNLAGWDLTTYSATRVSDATSYIDTVAPAAYGHFFGSNIYRASFALALELLQDASTLDGLQYGILGSLNEAFGISMGRGIGKDLISGAGSPTSPGNVPQGVLTGAVDSGLTNTSGSNGEIDFEFLRKLYFSLNRYHRQSPKAAFIMSDVSYEAIRDLRDDQGRPLIAITDDAETLFGANVVISPDMPSYSPSPSATGYIVFGNLANYVVRLSQMVVSRSLQSGMPNGVGDVTRGECLLNARMRCDAAVFDPSQGKVPPVIFGSITS